MPHMTVTTQDLTGPLKIPLDPAVSRLSKILDFCPDDFDKFRKSDLAFNTGNFYPDAVIWHPQNHNFPSPEHLYSVLTLSKKIKE